MRIRRLHQRARPFRYAAFWLMGGVCLLLWEQRAPSQVLTGAALCLLWPLLVDALLRRPLAGVAAERLAMGAYTAECGLAAALFAWVSLPPLPALAAVLCLLCGAAALAGQRLLLPSAAALLLGAGFGGHFAPQMTLASSAAADAVAMVLILGFGLALAQVSFRQAQRLDAHRQLQRLRSEGLERANHRLQRYLPPSLRRRIREAPDAATGSERRWLTVAFVDLVGFTELSARLDAEALAVVLDDYLAAVIEAAERGRGEVSKLLGDGVMVVFGSPGDADRHGQVLEAVEFCRQLPVLLGRLASQWRARGDLVQLHTRAGVASGFCTVGDRGGAERLDFTLIGPAVNLASRLQAHATPGGVLLDAATAALAENDYRLTPAETLDVKGVGPVLAYGLVDRPPPSVKVPAPLAHSTNRREH
ncbi:MAG: adenylate/guanylate cyclase domain-containing protein [Pseudomonadales bacterium]